jgi:hypothetical protein
MLAVPRIQWACPVDSIEKRPACLVPEDDDWRKLLAGPEGIDIRRAHPGPWHARGVGDRADRYLDQPVGGRLRVEPFLNLNVAARRAFQAPKRDSPSLPLSRKTNRCRSSCS